MTRIVGIVGIDVFLSDGGKVSAKDFFNTPKVGYGVQMLRDIGYEAIPIGDSDSCSSGLCDLQMDDVK